MAGGRKSIGATFVLRADNFFANVKKAEEKLGTLKTKLSDTAAKMGVQSKTYDKMGTSMASLAKRAVTTVAAYAGARQIVQFGQSCIDAANDQVKAEERLDQLMMNVKGTTKGAVESIKSYSSALQSVTTVGDEVSMVGASQLASFQMQADSIKTLMPAMNDLAVATYGVNVSQDQMQQTANLVGKVMSGNVGALTRVGVTFNDTQKKILQTGTESQKAAALVEVLGQNFGGLAQRMAQTPEGRIIQMKNAWGDVQEQIGNKLYPLLTDFFGWLAGKIPAAQQWITGAIDVIAPYAKTGLEMIKSGCHIAGAAVGFLKDHFNVLGPIIGVVVGAIATYRGITLAMAAAVKIATIAQGGLSAVFTANPLGLVIAALALLVLGIIAVVKNWDRLKQFFVSSIQTIKKAFSGIGQWFSNLWNGIKDKAVGAWNGIKSTAGNALDGIKSYTRSKLDAVRRTYEEHGGGIKGVVFGAMEGIKQYYSIGYDAINAMTGGKLGEVVGKIKSIFGGVKDFVGNVWDSIAGFAKQSINKIIGALNGLITGANKLQFDIPSWVPGLGGKKFGINIPKIPLLASGGVIRSAGNVIVGDGGPELLHLPKGASVEPLPKTGTSNQNTFYITIHAGGVDDGVEDMVRRVKMILSTM